MNIYDYAKELKELMGPYIGVHGSSGSLYQLADFVLRHKWNKGTVPPAEEEVLIIIEHKYPECRPVRSVTRAFYEDGTMKAVNSNYEWELAGQRADMDEDGDLQVPQGWYELNDYGDGINVVTDGVIAWQQVPDPWEGEDRQDDADQTGTDKEE